MLHWDERAGGASLSRTVRVGVLWALSVGQDTQPQPRVQGTLPRSLGLCLPICQTGVTAVPVS